ncbi:MAG: DUF6159 family protein [Candidatus Woesearchaeota archaeon]
MGAFSRSWELTKVCFRVMKLDKELLLFPLLSGIFSLLFVLAMVYPTIIVAVLNESGFGIVDGPLFYPFIFLLYFGLAFIATFFNVCVVYTVKTRFSGGNATFTESLSFAVSKLHLIFLWSLLAATVGLLLRLLERLAERFGGIGELVMRLVVSLLGMAWSFITLFVVPAMVYDNLTPFAAIKQSAKTLKKTWGESLIRELGLGLVSFVYFVLAVVLTVFLIFLVAPFGIWAILTVGFLGGLALVAGIVVFSVLNTIYNTALYSYAQTGTIPAGFDEDQVKHAFSQKPSSI